MSPGLLKVAERAKRDPDARFNSLAHLVDAGALERAYHRMRKDAAVGVDGITKERYRQRLEENLRGLHERMRAMRYRHQPIRRVHIPKSPGKTRPIGVSSTEDKIVQGALREVMEAIYEPNFLECSYGFRPGRSAHDALRATHDMVTREKLSVESGELHRSVVGRVRVSKAMRLGQKSILGTHPVPSHRRAPDLEAPADLPIREAPGPQPDNFLDLTHGQPLRRHPLLVSVEQKGNK